jgi:dihydrofolate reductase
VSKVISAHAVSFDGYISGRTPDGGKEFGRGLGDAPMLFDWYTDGDTPSQVFDGFKLSEPSARFFDAAAARVGAMVAGRATYEHSSHFGGGRPHPTAPLFVLSHRPMPEISERQTLVTTGIADAIAAAREAAGDKDVGLMGGGRSFFHELPKHVHLRLLEAVPAPGVTQLRYEVVR